MRRLAPALVALAACSTRAAPAPPEASASASAVIPAPTSDRIDAIVTAEVRRDAGGITPADQQSRDVEVRRAAARALARIAGEAARPGLLRALADEDDEVIAWAAYGLGFVCKGHEKDNVSALVARAVARSTPPGAPARLEPTTAIARAVGRCAADESEPTLVAWLAGPRDRAAAAAYGLGDLADGKQRLREETLAALLNVAVGSAAAPPVGDALYPVGRLENVPLTVVARIREVASARLAEAGDARIFAVRALGRGGDDAAGELTRVLTTAGTFTPSERAEAARELNRLGHVGQRALAGALPGLVPSADPIALTGLMGDDLGVLLTVLESLDASAAASAAGRKALAAFAALPLPPGAPLPLARRIAWLRCGAATALAWDDIKSAALAACDVTADPPGTIGQRALVDVLGRAPLVGPRLAAFTALAQKGDLRAREAAIELLETHDEVEGAAGLLAEALAAKESGLVAKAADVLAKQPQRAGEARRGKRAKHKKAAKDDDAPLAEALAPSPLIVKALLDALGRPDAALDPELADSVIGAVGALAIKEARPRLDELCRSPYPTTRERAEKALGLLGGEKKTCPAKELAPIPKELATRLREPMTLTFDTDAGALAMRLDPALAPVIVTRVVELARAGYYDGKIVHRVVPWFVTQFGAPFGDGAGGPEGKAAVPCETSPLPFAPLSVGIALAGRDTGLSQLFVMHVRAPHLDGGYALIGTATGPWAAFVDGDVIQRVTVGPPLP